MGAAIEDRASWSSLLRTGPRVQARKSLIYKVFFRLYPGARRKLLIYIGFFGARAERDRQAAPPVDQLVSNQAGCGVCE